MDKYLFTDGIGGVKEIHSKEELLSLVKSSADPAAIRIWKFKSTEWISYADLLKKDPSFTSNERKIIPPATKQGAASNKKKAWKSTLLVACILGSALLVFNFTSAGWEASPAFQSNARRPANVPNMDIDSLIDEIEWMRGKLLDKNTRYNLRLRNNWPEYLQLQINADKETNGSSSRFLNLKLSLENASGLMVDRAVVDLFLWKDGQRELADTLMFEQIPYDRTTKRNFNGMFKADSITVAFRSINAKAFNFCYNISVKNNSGNYNDRWFCRDGKTNE